MPKYLYRAVIMFALRQSLCARETVVNEKCDCLVTLTRNDNDEIHSIYTVLCFSYKDHVTNEEVCTKIK